jgi:hypothetical protein
MRRAGHLSYQENGGREMRVKFVEFEKNQMVLCTPCCYWKHHCTHTRYPKCNCTPLRKDGKQGYFVAVQSKPRAGKYERLLKALLKCFTVESKLLLISGHLSMLTPKNEQQLIAIKQRMEKGVKV